jgi:hypothetical protein
MGQTGTGPNPQQQAYRLDDYPAPNHEAKVIEEALRVEIVKKGPVYRCQIAGKDRNAQSDERAAGDPHLGTRVNDLSRHGWSYGSGT